MIRTKLLIASAFTLLAPTAHASAPMSVWATLDFVRIEQGRDQKPQVTLEGTFVPADGRTATRGRVVYVCNEADASPCLQAWIDLVKAARAGTCVGWGQRPTPAPKPTPLAEPTPTPLAWQVGLGVNTSSTRCRSAVRND